MSQKSSLNIEAITKFIEASLDALGSKTVKRSNVKYTGRPTHLWCTRCDFAAKSRPALAKHKKLNHALNASSKHSPSTSLVVPLHHSTRNNSIAEGLLNDNITLKDLSQSVEEVEVESIAAQQKKDVLKYTCLDCDFKTKLKSHMERHVKDIHNLRKGKSTSCGTCDHEFVEVDNYNAHVKIHDVPKKDAVPSEEPEVLIEDLLDDSGHDDGGTIPTCISQEERCS